jgi:hypothetical protein
MTADPRIIKLSLEILAQVDQGTITLNSLEKALAAFADEIRARTPINAPRARRTVKKLSILFKLTSRDN